MTLHPAFDVAAAAAQRAYEQVARMSRGAREEIVAEGADGTPTMRLDAVVEDAVVEALDPLGVNVLSEEIGFVDHGSACTLVIDPVDGSANAAAGVPLACFSAALAVDELFTEALTVWLDTGRRWWGTRDVPFVGRTTGRAFLTGAAVSLLRPHERNRESWRSIADRAGRVRILSCSTLEAALVADGATDAFADAGSDTHRLVDLAAALVLVPAAGGVVRDAFDRPLAFDTDLTKRWSGVTAATPQLAEELCELIQNAAASHRPPPGVARDRGCSPGLSTVAVDPIDHPEEMA